MSALVELPAITDLAKIYSLDAAAFVHTFRAVAMPKPHTDAEFVSCCLVAREHGLNPLTKEIHFMRDKRGNIQALVGVDGWVRKCNEHAQFDGIEFTDNTDENGKLLSITARIYRKDRSRPTSVTEYMAECIQQRDKAGPWQSHPSRMLRHRALIQCARLAFGFAGLMEPDEFQQWQGAKDITPAPAVLDLPDIPDEPDEPDDAGSDQSAVLREIERALKIKPAVAVEREYATAIMAMDEDGRTAAIDMIQEAISAA